MKRKVILRDSALDDIDAIIAWYDEQLESLSDDFLLEVERCLYLLTERPFAFSEKFHSMREIPLHRFPYVMVYKVENSVVLVLAVCHYKRQSHRISQVEEP